MSFRRILLAAWAALGLACGEPATESVDGTADVPPGNDLGEPIEFASAEEMELELEILDNEIAGLEEYLEANPGWTPPEPTDPDPRAVLAAARSTRDAAASALAVADTARAADSLRAASARIEHAKRLLFVAEEMGIEFEPAAESMPAD